MRASPPLILLLLLACSSFEPTGQLQVLRPTPIERSAAEALDTRLELVPGNYSGRLLRHTRRTLSFELATTGSTEFVIELDENVESFPTDGGVFFYSADMHNQDFEIRGEFIPWEEGRYRQVEYVQCAAQIIYVRECYPTDDEGNVQCVTVPRTRYGQREVRYTRVVEAVDIGVTFLHPQSNEVLARYFESIPMGSRRINERRGACL